GGGHALHEAAAGYSRSEGVERHHRPPPAGLTDWISYIPPSPFSIVKSTRVPGFSVRRSTAGATAKSIVIPGQPSAGIGPWVRLILCPDASTELTVPVPCACPCPACAICISGEAAAVRCRP